jgi:hypothetical protein
MVPQESGQLRALPGICADDGGRKADDGGRPGSLLWPRHQDSGMRHRGTFSGGKCVANDEATELEHLLKENFDLLARLAEYENLFRLHGLPPPYL